MSVTSAQLQGEVERLSAEHRVPGVVAAVWQDGVLATAATGVRNLNTGDPMTVDTAFVTGSVTKVWTTTLVMTLVEEGLLSLDEKIVTYAPDVRFGADPKVARSLTVRHLLNHSSGVDTGDLFTVSREYPDGVEDYLEPIAQAGQLVRPGTCSSYNNVGWIVLELVLRRVTGKNVHELLRERVIEPLGLGRTVLSAREAMLHRTAVGSFPTDDGGHEATSQFLYPGAWAAAGTTLITTTADTVRFLRMHLDGGRTVDGRRVLTASSTAATQTPTIHEPTGPASGFGLGWHYDDLHGRRLLSHGGGSIGGVCEAVVSPSDNLVSIAFVNSGLGGRVLHDLRSVLVPWSAWPPAAEPRHDVDLAPFVGTYLRRSDRLDVVPSGDGLLVRTTPILEDLHNALVPFTSQTSELHLVATSPSELVSGLDGSSSGRTVMTFHEPGPHGFELLYTDLRLARRSTGPGQ
jgi:CubicO group peptidase (beta-lactamase class C family)